MTPTYDMTQIVPPVCACDPEWISVPLTRCEAEAIGAIVAAFNYQQPLTGRDLEHLTRFSARTFGALIARRDGVLPDHLLTHYLGGEMETQA